MKYKVDGYSKNSELEGDKVRMLAPLPTRNASTVGKERSGSLTQALVFSLLAPTDMECQYLYHYGYNEQIGERNEEDN